MEKEYTITLNKEECKIVLHAVMLRELKYSTEKWQDQESISRELYNKIGQQLIDQEEKKES